MTTLRKLAAGLVAFTALTSAASAASITTLTQDPSDKESGFFYVVVYGRIEPGDDAKFDKLVADKGIKSAVVDLNSPGGEMYAGLGIGRSVKRHNFDTVVGGESTCTSMCALIWVAGMQRYYEGKAKIGFHSMAVADKKTGKVYGASNGGNALVGSYLSSLGMTDKAIFYLTSAPPNQLLWMNVKVAAALDITITDLNKAFPSSSKGEPASTQTSVAVKKPAAKKSDRFSPEAQ